MDTYLLIIIRYNNNVIYLLFMCQREKEKERENENFIVLIRYPILYKYKTNVMLIRYHDICVIVIVSTKVKDVVELYKINLTAL